MEVQLKVLVGSSAGQTIKIAGPKFYIGRSEDCQLRPRSDLISRHHCALIVEGEYVAIRDFGSKNGTYVNGQRVSSEQELKPGDHLKVGPLEFEVLIDYGSLGGPKKPKVTSVKEAAARTADSGIINTKDNPQDIDLSQWLGEDLVGEGDTREMPSPSETTEVSLGNMSGSSEQPIAPPKPDENQPNKPASKSGDSNDAAAEMLRKLRRYR
jgi:predicted component of type VI protein secretion system